MTKTKFPFDAMKLTRISAWNIKGETFTFDLSDAVAIVGPNFSGKTAVIEAIRLLFKGYIPEIGKRPSSIWELSSGNEMKVEGVFDNAGDKMSRAWWREGSTIKERADAPIGFDLVAIENLPLLDAQAYFEMTDSQRTSYVFERVKLPDSYTREGIIAECERISFEEEHTEVIERAKTELIDHLRKSKSPTIQEYLANALDAFRESFTYWNKRSKETQGAVKTLTELKLREKECSTDSLRQLETEITEAQGELDKLNAAKGRLSAQQDEAQRVAGRKKEIRKRLDQDRTDYAKIIGDLRRKVAEAKILTVPTKEDREKTKQSLSNLVEVIDGVMAGITLDEKTIAKAQDQLQKLDSLKACPFCKSKGKDWKAHLGTELDQTVSTCTKQLKESKKYIEDLRDQMVKLSKRREQEEKDYETNEATLRSIDQWNAEIDRQVTASARDQDTHRELQEELDGLNILPIESSLDLTPILHNIATYAGKRDGLTARKKAALALQQDLKRAAQSQLEHQSAVAHVKVIKAIADVLKEKREAMITVVFGELLAIANKLVEGILKSPLSLHENTVGRWKDAKFIPHRVFSGTEKALTYIAIATALSAQAPLKLVILDEFNRLDHLNQSLVIGRLLLMVGKIIDQFIIVGTSVPKSRDMTIIEFK